MQQSVNHLPTRIRRADAVRPLSMAMAVVSMAVAVWLVVVLPMAIDGGGRRRRQLMAAVVVVVVVVVAVMPMMLMGARRPRHLTLI